MYYCIERTGEPFNGAFNSISLGNLVFDIMQSHSNKSMFDISTFVIDNNYILTKSDPRIEAEFKLKFEQQIHKIQELLLG